MRQPNAPYAQAAELLDQRLREYQLNVLKRRNMTLEDIRALLGVESVSAVKYWLDGLRKPRRDMAVQIGVKLKLEDPFEIAAAYGYERATDESRATLAELVEAVAQGHTTDKEDIIKGLVRASQPATPYEEETINFYLRQPWPLETRARYIAALADMASSKLIAHVA